MKNVPKFVTKPFTVQTLPTSGGIDPTEIATWQKLHEITDITGPHFKTADMLGHRLHGQGSKSSIISSYCESMAFLSSAANRETTWPAPSTAKQDQLFGADQLLNRRNIKWRNKANQEKHRKTQVAPPQLVSSAVCKGIPNLKTFVRKGFDRLKILWSIWNSTLIKSWAVYHDPVWIWHSSFGPQPWRQLEASDSLGVKAQGLNMLNRWCAGAREAWTDKSKL